MHAAHCWVTGKREDQRKVHFTHPCRIRGGLGDLCVSVCVRVCVCVCMYVCVWRSGVGAIGLGRLPCKRPPGPCKRQGVWTAGGRRATGGGQAFKSSLG